MALMLINFGHITQRWGHKACNAQPGTEMPLLLLLKPTSHEISAVSDTRPLSRARPRVPRVTPLWITADTAGDA